ncbi:MAG TPA: nucleotidyltransferase domain-containing protein [Phytomonospora sp.]
MFTPAEREELRDALIERARADERVAGAALTGSAAAGTEDRWSDVDLFFGLAVGADQTAVLADWTAWMRSEAGAVEHMDVRLGGTVYRVFLLASTLQVDLAFAPAGEFGAIAPTFRLLFGESVERPRSAPPDTAGLIGWAWLYALHARSSVERGKAWQAEYMISGLRDHVLALACVRHGVPASQGRGMDLLPAEVTRPLAGALDASLDEAALRRAFAAAVRGLLVEVEAVDADLADRLRGPLAELAG